MTSNVKKKKKKRRRYRLVWPWNNPAVQKRKQQEQYEALQHPKRKKKRRRKIRPQAVGILAAVIAIIILIQVPRWRTNKALKTLGYDKATIKNIRAQNLTRTLIDNNYYSAYLAQSINDGTLNTDYLVYYTVVSVDNPLDAQDFLLISRLKDKGYVDEQIENFYHDLHYWEITPLLVFDYQPIEQNYIDDCKAHEDTNSEDHFELSGDYYTEYQNTQQVPDPCDTMLVNKSWYLSDTYVPEGLRQMSNYYAASGQALAADAADAMEAFGDAGRDNGVTFYVSSGYRSYEDQASVYDNYVLGLGTQEAADQAAARAGYSEHQTGLAMDLAASNEDPSLEFKDTRAFQWVSQNAAAYGWILRFPDGKEDITGYEYEPWHYRYVTTDVAQAVSASHLTYDEFWMLYLAPWNNEADKPSQDILTASDYHTLTGTQPSAAPSASPSAS